MSSNSQDMDREVKVFFVGSYPPRNCGIATFTYDLSHALCEVTGKRSYRVAAMTNVPEGYDYPEEVSFEIHQNRIHDYRLAADYVNFSGADVVSLQHAFGIYGGAAGTYINHPRGERIRLRDGVYRRIKEREWILDRIDGEGVHLLHETGAYGLIVRMEDIDWDTVQGTAHGRSRNFLYSGGRTRN